MKDIMENISSFGYTSENEKGFFELNWKLKTNKLKKMLKIKDYFQVHCDHNVGVLYLHDRKTSYFLDIVWYDENNQIITDEKTLKLIDEIIAKFRK